MVIMFKDVFEHGLVKIGLKGIPPALSTTFSAVFTNVALSWFKGWNKELLLMATILMTTFTGTLACVTLDAPKTAVALSTVAGFGVDGVLVPAATIAITVTPDTTTATSIALSLSIRAIGAIGYAIHYNVFVNRLTPRLISYVGGRTVLAGLPLTLAEAFVGAFLAAPESLTQVPGVTPEIIAAGDYGRRWAYAEALKYVWLVSIAFGCIAIIACCFLGSPKKYMTKHIAAHIS